MLKMVMSVVADFLFISGAEQPPARAAINTRDTSGTSDSFFIVDIRTSLIKIKNLQQPLALLQTSILSGIN